MTIRSQEPKGEFPMKDLVQYEPRIGRVDLYMSIAHLFSHRSTCLRGHVGCVAVKNNRIVCAGYNGAPAGMPHCSDVGCGGDEGTVDMPSFPNGCTRAIHAEQNMVAFAARVGVSLEGATVYATHGPCLPCGQALVASGIGTLYYETPYRLPQGLELVDQANIKVVKYGD